jgi:hypothetical protein
MRLQKRCSEALQKKFARKSYMLSVLTLITTRVLIVIGKWRPDRVEMKRVYGGSFTTLKTIALEPIKGV